MFKIGDNVRFGVRTSDMRSGRNRADGRNGGILRLDGKIIAFENDLYVVKSSSNYERFPPGKLYNLRKLKGGWVVEGQRDDPKGRLYLTLNNEDLD